MKPQLLRTDVWKVKLCTEIPVNLFIQDIYNDKKLDEKTLENSQQEEKKENPKADVVVKRTDVCGLCKKNGKDKKKKIYLTWL